LRTDGKLIAIDVLHYSGELRSANRFEGDVPDVESSDQELKLAVSLIEQMQQPEFDATQYEDDYMARMKSLIDSKLKGKKIATPQSEETPGVINFMDALRKSVKAIPVPKDTTAKRRPPATVKSTARRTTPAKKASHRKTG
jgi:DNA end-binding protein Ku